MEYEFELIYELDCTVGEAVAAYLDAEHYMYLHSNYMPQYETLWQDGSRIAIRQSWKKGPIVIGNTCITEYEAPARFLNYDLKPVPRWLPSVHHLIDTWTELRYYPAEDGRHTVSHLTVKLRMPWFLWPLRKMIEARLVKLKIEKDQEDVDMIARHQKMAGRGNIRGYFKKNVFLLHKEAFVKAFSKEAGVSSTNAS